MICLEPDLAAKSRSENHPAVRLVPAEQATWMLGIC
ncbi:hypothetical protein MMUC44124_20220 [Mycolicibacterium mucogenicum DSM 44124]|nr:hypothetical protein MMUC44124_20220 [Mycolicibacterium mucogenicum DSM 44124]